MNESDARQVLLVRAVETAPASDAAALWRSEDAAWASAEARRRVGERAGADTYLAARAGLALQRLGERDAAWRIAPLPPGPSALAVAAAFGAIVVATLIVGNVLGPERRLNLLAPPVWGLLAWNLCVYAALGIAALRRWRRPAVVDHAGGSGWAHLVRRMSAVVATRAAAVPVAAVRRRHVADWALASAPLQSHRIAAVLHLAAAVLALGVVMSMYLAGLAFDFRAGWDSTWLDAGQVQRVLKAVFGPAAALGGIELPDAAALARLRWAEGSAGESAARWIHLYALTLAGAVDRAAPRVGSAGQTACAPGRAADRVAAGRAVLSTTAARAAGAALDGVGAALQLPARRRATGGPRAGRGRGARRGRCAAAGRNAATRCRGRTAAPAAHRPRRKPCAAVRGLGHARARNPWCVRSGGARAAAVGKLGGAGRRVRSAPAVRLVLAMAPGACSSAAKPGNACCRACRCRHRISSTSAACTRHERRPVIGRNRRADRVAEPGVAHQRGQDHAGAHAARHATSARCATRPT